MVGRKSIAEIRREEIIEAFYQVVSEKGLAKATVRETAKVAGCTYSTLHHYFANKEEIILAFINRLTREYLTEIRKELSELTTPNDRLRYLSSLASGSMPGRFSLEFCRAWVDCWALAKTQPAVSEALQEYYNEHRDFLADIVRQGIEAGEFRKVQPENTANLMLAIVEGTMMLWVVNTPGISVEALSKSIPGFFGSYLMPEGVSPESAVRSSGKG